MLADRIRPDPQPSGISRRWSQDSGPRAVFSGPWSRGHGPGAVAWGCGPKAVFPRPCSQGRVPRAAVPRPWFWGCGPGAVVPGPWSWDRGPEAVVPKMYLKQKESSVLGDVPGRQKYWEKKKRGCTGGCTGSTKIVIFSPRVYRRVYRSMQAEQKNHLFCHT